MLQRIGRYEILDRVASGGQGTVYRARDTVLDRIVAVKVINQSTEDDPAYLEALQREARLAARLDHPNITRVHDFQVEDGVPYIVMEFIPDALDRELRGSERLPWRRAVEIGLQTSRALQHAHDQGVVHRDIKPQNILLRETGAAAVSDFGIARAFASSTRSQSGGVMGTPTYMSPEQWEGGSVDSRLDQYGLGIVLYELITGSPPFQGDSWGALYVQHREAPVPPISSSLQVPDEVERVIRKTLEKSAEARYGSASELADALEGALTGGAAQSPRTEVSPPPRREPPRPEPAAAPPPRPPQPPAPPRQPAASAAGNGRNGGWVFGGLGVAVAATVLVISLVSGGGGGDGSPAQVPAYMAASTPVKPAAKAPAARAPTARAPTAKAPAAKAPAARAPTTKAATTQTVTPIPRPAVQVTKSPPSRVRPTGTINYGVKETGIFEGHPRFISSPRYQYMAVTAGESMVTIQPDFSPAPSLAIEWSIADDFVTWTWKIRDDVEFQKGYGNLTVDDILYSFKEYHEGALNARAGIIGDYWVGNVGGTQTVVDPYTVIIDTGEPWVPARAFEFMRHLGGLSTSIVSKKQSEELGAEKASVDIAMTGPWEIQDHRSGVFWKFSAVEDHWRQTPHFAELVLWTIPEESARVAGFQTGNLDTFQMAFDTIPTVEAVEGAVMVGWPNAGQAGLNIYGQTYGADKYGNPYDKLDCNNAWVSCDEDPDSAEWAKAVKVKRAMAISIDRQVIVDTILSGFGDPLFMRDWMGHQGIANPRWKFEYDPYAAKKLLSEAGYPNGFEITLTPAIRGAPGETEACEAVAQYWEAIGIDVKIQNVPYATIRPSLITRQYQGVTCHTVGARLHPIIGASNYVKKSIFSYGTEHPWMEEHISAALLQVDPGKLERQTLEVYDWMYDNVMAFGLYTHYGVWPIGPRLDPDWIPFGFSEVRTPTGFEYIKHR